MKTIITFVLLCFLPGQALGTAQIPDRITYNGKSYALNSNPLQKLFDEQEDLLPKSSVVSTANWRGYVATFEIENNILRVADVAIRKSRHTKEAEYYWHSVIEEVFPDPAQRVLNWYTGLLILPIGKQVHYIHLSYASSYENYRLIRIKSGEVIETAKMNLSEYICYKKHQFGIYQSTQAYAERVKELQEVDRQIPDDEIDYDEFLFNMGGFTEFTDVPFSEHKNLMKAASKTPDKQACGSLATF